MKRRRRRRVIRFLLCISVRSRDRRWRRHLPGRKIAILRTIPKKHEAFSCASAAIFLGRTFTVHSHSNTMLSGLSPTFSCNTMRSTTRYPRGRVLTVPPYRIPVQLHIIILIQQSTNHIPSTFFFDFRHCIPIHRTNQSIRNTHSSSPLLILFSYHSLSNFFSLSLLG